MASFSFLTSTMASFSLSCVNLGYVAKQRRRKNGQYRLAFYQEQNEILETIKNAEELELAERMDYSSQIDIYRKRTYSSDDPAKSKDWLRQLSNSLRQLRLKFFTKCSTN